MGDLQFAQLGVILDDERRTRLVRKLVMTMKRCRWITRHQLFAELDEGGSLLGSASVLAFAIPVLD